MVIYNVAPPSPTQHPGAPSRPQHFLPAPRCTYAQCSVHFVQLERAAPGLRFWYDYRGLLVKMCYSEAYSIKYCYYENGVGGSGCGGGCCARSRGDP